MRQSPLEDATIIAREVHEYPIIPDGSVESNIRLTTCTNDSSGMAKANLVSQCLKVIGYEDVNKESGILGTEIEVKSVEEEVESLEEEIKSL